MIDEVLLTEDEMEKAIGGEFVDDPLMILDFQSACKAAQLKLLELIKANMNKREVGGEYPEWALSDKFIRKLEARLKEG